jgi:glycosyltransferase involved in cell wall biosynthesis
MQRELAKDGVTADLLYPAVPPPSPAFRRAPAAEPVFVYCGRLSVEKGLPLLLRAFARLRAEVPTAHLRIVGDGPQRAVLEQLTSSLSLTEAITFTGRVNPDRVEQQLEDAWALVAPSLWAEPLGLVALEAIIRGVPVIVSASGGFGETVTDGVSGLLFPNGDEGELVRRLQAVAQRQAFPSHLLPEDIVRQVTESYSLTRHIECLRRVFGEIARPIATQIR